MPASPSEFEEKEYEGPLYNQLEVGTNLLWSPGQVFEHHVGIDRAIFIKDPVIWKAFGYDRAPRGVFLDEYDWSYIWRRRRRRPLPDFRLNFFVQAKRCYFHNPRPKRLAKKGIGSPCWRFDTDPNQQEALEKVAAQVKRRALLCYAAPAFHRLTQLYGHTSAGTVVEHSTFPPIARLKDHSAWYFDSPGGSGVANPEAEFVDGPDLQTQLEIFYEQAPLEEPSSLNNLSRVITSGIAELPDENPRKAIFFEHLRSLRTRLSELFIFGEEAQAFADVALFADEFNVRWYAVGRAPMIGK
jgi:hypothetical protein